MISVAEAKALIQDHVQRLPLVKRPLLQAVHHILAQDIVAKQDIPAFRQSSMDGYAFCFSDKNSALSIRGEVAAGNGKDIAVRQGEAVRIFTGAPVPTGVNTVVMQEKVKVEGGMLTVLDEGLEEGGNVRPVGAEVKQGTVGMKAGDLLSPAAIGFIAGLGETEVSVYPMPTVQIIVTGKELQSPGFPLSPGQVYESNSFLLRAALQQVGISTVHLMQADDDLHVLQAMLEQALEKSDVVLLTGGVSVGDYDFVVEAARRSNVQALFHRVRQRPGKPLYFGMRRNKPVFGLPGNPSSVLSCFYHYVLPALGYLSGRELALKKCVAQLTVAVSKPKGLTTFLKGWYQNGMAAPLGAQESFRLSSFAQANCLISIEEGQTDVLAGEMVDVYLLPGID